ncbi:ABC transporter ATP-binding protein [Gordonia rhizosphera]|uniref:Putative ABC transporter ATP-binding protein n=1 Tax=Gordonia rhizosphera NBRC 16068 TaxID=1108045 RepID=K6W7R2_9ACTN|nr:ABC transporter ATP-binding protein [Gordonia rhizosphera]GAB89756.1 putative ABC transporter ATP-binding protein [Gordonia rhizosphera NBRC 16068]
MSATPLLHVRALSARYGSAQALFGISFDLPTNSAIAVLGPNGAGKSTLARTISGLIPATAGTIEFNGTNITRHSADKIRREGLIHLPEGRGVFARLTVMENLRLALAVDKVDRSEAIARAFDYFPVLAKRRKQIAGTLSGGEQQMLSLARALMVNPKVVIADEMSLGLAPKMVDTVFDALTAARQEGVSVIMIEQFAGRAIQFADHCLILQRGNLAWSGPAHKAGDELLHRYLGSATAA